MPPIDNAESELSALLNGLLPSAYAQSLDEESSAGLKLALDGMRSSASEGDLSRGATFHCAALRRHMSLKHGMTDEARVQAIEVLYQLIVADVPVALTVRRRWSSAFCKLMRKAKHLDFKLPWRPLLNQLLLYCTSKLRVAHYTSRANASAHLTQLASCAAQCRRHFPEGSAAEIMQAIEPMLCPKDPQFFSGCALLSLLLPTRGREGAVWQARMLTLWRGSGIEGCVEWEMLFMLLFKRLAKDAFVGKVRAHARAMRRRPRMNATHRPAPPPEPPPRQTCGPHVTSPAPRLSLAGGFRHHRLARAPANSFLAHPPAAQPTGGHRPGPPTGLDLHHRCIHAPPERLGSADDHTSCRLAHHRPRSPAAAALSRARAAS